MKVIASHMTLWYNITKEVVNVRKVFVEDLPHKGKLINWVESKGHKVKFIYDDLEGELEIIQNNTITKQCEVSYNGIKSKIQTSSIPLGKIGFVIGKTTRAYRYKIGDKVATVTGEVIIIDHIRLKQNERGYKYKCSKDGYVGVIKESHLEDGVGCPVCSNKMVIKGINDLATTCPRMTKYFKNKEDTFIYTDHSSKKVATKCPLCGYEKEVVIHTLCNRGLSCICNDGICYPEKFVVALIEQLHLEFIYQKSNFGWSQNKVYDFYIPHLKCIIETNGGQHYIEHGFNSFGGNTLEDERENDTLKEKLAIENGIKHYITIDCRKSELEFIKNSILNSKLSEMYDLSNIKWLKCHEYACSNLVKKASDYWNSGIKNTNTIAKNLNLSNSSIIRYLKQGVELKWNDYYDKRFRKIICLNNLRVYDSCKDAMKSLNAINLYASNLSKCCNGIRENAGKLPNGTKLKWKYYDVYTKLKEVD